VRTDSAGSGYQRVAPEPLARQGALTFEIVQAPENALHQHKGLFGLLAGAGLDDELLVEQFDEPLRWAGGLQLSPRLTAYLAAARRGARVRVLLDRYYADLLDPNGSATAAKINREVALQVQSERITSVLPRQPGSGLGSRRRQSLPDVSTAVSTPEPRFMGTSRTCQR
jgi:hypothetical protein